jgi:hypothetical protein
MEKYGPSWFSRSAKWLWLEIRCKKSNIWDVSYLTSHQPNVKKEMIYPEPSSNHSSSTISTKEKQSGLCDILTTSS